MEKPPRRVPAVEAAATSPVVLFPRRALTAPINRGKSSAIAARARSLASGSRRIVAPIFCDLKICGRKHAGCAWLGSRLGILNAQLLHGVDDHVDA